MALKVSAELYNGGSYLCGEKLHCRVQFRNESTSEDQVVAWCGTQLLCQCTFREDLVSPPPYPSGGLPETQTAFLPSRGALPCFESFPVCSTVGTWFMILDCYMSYVSSRCICISMFMCISVHCVVDQYHWVVSVWSQCMAYTVCGVGCHIPL